MTRETTSAMRRDQLGTSHPIYQPVSTPNEIGEIFDAISYSKGASVLNMLNYTLGPANFRLGIHVIYIAEALFPNFFSVS